MGYSYRQKLHFQPSSDEHDRQKMINDRNFSIQLKVEPVFTRLKSLDDAKEWHFYWVMKGVNSQNAFLWRYRGRADMGKGYTDQPYTTNPYYELDTLVDGDLRTDMPRVFMHTLDNYRIDLNLDEPNGFHMLVSLDDGSSIILPRAIMLPNHPDYDHYRA